ncbi:melanotransferrin-like [Mya arenaria]|uniref:melanotransferrin-like n=1 Tax=Mya arenaria TaxID=6604 RepID=UPI0022E6969F|nr:melanotransferrin-like [Mya arenaria]XP_052772778.1 melanotransferrin-like [Mya arenaria]
MKSIHCLLCLTIVLTFFIEGIKSQALPEAALARWCVTTEAAEQKCNEFVDAIQMVIGKGQLAQKVRSVYNGPKGYDFSQMPQLSCIRANDEFECMNLFDKNEVDLITLEAGQGYFAGRFHSMRPILAEKYDTVPGAPLDYYAVAIKKTGSVVAINNLQNKNACMPGIGTGAGWVYPISFMLKANMMEVTECNAIVKTVTNFYQQMCLPGALNSFYNQFGNNPASVCELCRGSGEEKCTSSDPHAGFDGALRCLNNGGEVAFVRHDTVMTNDPASAENYQLVCSDLTSRGVDEFESCNFGKVPNDIVMTTGLKSDAVVKKLKEFLIQTSDWFGFDGPYKANFSMFTSTSVDYLERKNVMFNDATKMLVDVGSERDRYYTWINDEFRSNLLNLNICPIDVVRLCVISDAEREKCERMVEVFRGKDIKPDMDCIQTSSTLDCMKLLSTGDADLCMLDAGDVYRAGKQYNLVPIAAEDYGDMTGTYKVVAAARKRDLYMTLFNLKDYRACHAGIGRGDGWIIPLNIYIETQQFIPAQCTIFNNLGELFSRSCIPGALDEEYNPSGKPVNLCEACQGGGYRKCKRNSDELYYGATGAFRCLTELGGDIAFVHHLTVGDNTDGRNQAIWARNRRSDDYELLCKDGTRTSIVNWANCYLGEVPGAALMTSGFVTQQRRDIYWNIFSYGQQFFSSDIDGDFHMFDSGLFYTDLIFTDEAVRLIPVSPERQNYKDYLGWDFINQIHNLDEYQCVPVPGSSSIFHPSYTLILVAMAIYSLFSS